MYSIYGLVDPRDNTTHYIGITDDVYGRFTTHIRIRELNEQKNAWIRELREQQIMVRMDRLDTAETREDAEDRETYWIQHYLKEQAPLTNTRIIPIRHTSVTKKTPGLIQLWVTSEYYRFVLSRLRDMRVPMEGDEYSVSSDGIEYASRDGTAIYIVILAYKEWVWDFLLRWAKSALTLHLIKRYEQVRYDVWSDGKDYGRWFEVCRPPIPF